MKFDEFSADRPANRLIHSTIHKLLPMVRLPQNQQLLYQLRLCFDEIPLSRQWQTDWDRHRIDRTMQHYNSVLQWVGLFLFGHGLTTFQGKHINQSLLFPMEEIFEDFVTYQFRKYQNQYSVKSQGPREPLAQLNGTDDAFYMKPDISLMSSGRVIYILDTKWKRINEQNDDQVKHGISQADMYQLYSYGKSYSEKHSCKKVALIYPRTNKFKEHLHYRFDDNLSLYCFPFDVSNPEDSVKIIMEKLSKN